MSFHPIKPSDLGLPDNADLDYIPTQEELRAAAVRALDDLTAMFILNHDNEQVIAERLDEIASILLAASQVPGSHQSKAIKLGVYRGPHFWEAQNKLDSYLQLIMPLLKTALEIGDPELQAEVYRAWGVCLHLTNSPQNRAQSKAALKIALEYAASSHDENLRLLAHVERFNNQVENAQLLNPQLEAQALLAEARRLKNSYLEGRVYLTLAIYYHKQLDYQQTFLYAQQSAIIMWFEKDYRMLGAAINYILSAVHPQNMHQAYFQELLNALEKISTYTIAPWIKATLYHDKAVQHYQRGNYDEARRSLLQSRLCFREQRFQSNLAVSSHMLGLIQTKRHRWLLAEHHLRSATNRYQHTKAEQIHLIHVLHALAFVPYEKGDYEKALVQLQATKQSAEALPASPACDWIIRELNADIAKTENKIAQQ